MWSDLPDQPNMYYLVKSLADVYLDNVSSIFRSQLKKLIETDEIQTSLQDPRHPPGSRMTCSHSGLEERKMPACGFFEHRLAVTPHYLNQATSWPKGLDIQISWKLIGLCRLSTYMYVDAHTF